MRERSLSQGEGQDPFAVGQGDRGLGHDRKENTLDKTLKWDIPFPQDTDERLRAQLTP